MRTAKTFDTRQWTAIESGGHNFLDKQANLGMGFILYRVLLHWHFAERIILLLAARWFIQLESKNLWGI